MKLILPDAIWRPDIISGAVLLYFRDEATFALHPSASTHLAAADPFSFFKFVEDRRPDWAQVFFAFVGIWHRYRGSLQHTFEMLQPLGEAGFNSMLLSYPRHDPAMEAADNLLRSSSLDEKAIFDCIDPFSASDELFAHLFFEKYLEFWHQTKRAENIADAPRPELWPNLYNYCDQLFAHHTLEQILTKVYMFRMPFLRSAASILLTNERLVPFMASLPVEGREAEESKRENVVDVATWEFFRQLVSPAVDPLDEKRVQLLSKLKLARGAEATRLRDRCFALANELTGDVKMEQLPKQVQDHIRISVQKEVQELLDLDKQALGEFLDLVFSDQKSWAGILTFIASLVVGSPYLGAGAAIATLSNLGAKAYSVAASENRKLRASDFALIYRLKN
jgi:hypothetical protein